MSTSAVDDSEPISSTALPWHDRVRESLVRLLKFTRAVGDDGAFDADEETIVDGVVAGTKEATSMLEEVRSYFVASLQDFFAVRLDSLDADDRTELCDCVQAVVHNYAVAISVLLRPLSVAKTTFKSVGADYLRRLIHEYDAFEPQIDSLPNIQNLHECLADSSCSIRRSEKRILTRLNRYEMDSLLSTVDVGGVPLDEFNVASVADRNTLKHYFGVSSRPMRRHPRRKGKKKTLARRRRRRSQASRLRNAPPPPPRVVPLRSGSSVQFGGPSRRVLRSHDAIDDDSDVEPVSEGGYYKNFRDVPRSTMRSVPSILPEDEEEEEESEDEVDPDAEFVVEHAGDKRARSTEDEVSVYEPPKKRARFYHPVTEWIRDRIGVAPSDPLRRMLWHVRNRLFRNAFNTRLDLNVRQCTVSIPYVPNTEEPILDRLLNSTKYAEEGVSGETRASGLRIWGRKRTNGQRWTRNKYVFLRSDVKRFALCDGEEATWDMIQDTPTGYNRVKLEVSKYTMWVYPTMCELQFQVDFAKKNSNLKRDVSQLVGSLRRPESYLIPIRLSVGDKTLGAYVAPQEAPEKVKRPFLDVIMQYSTTYYTQHIGGTVPQLDMKFRMLMTRTVGEGEIWYRLYSPFV